MQLAIEKAREHCVSLRVVGSVPPHKTSSRPWFNWLSVFLDLRCKGDRAVVAGFGCWLVAGSGGAGHLAPSQTPRLSTILHTGGDAFSGTMLQITHLGRVVDGPHVVPIDLEPQTDRNAVLA